MQSNISIARLSAAPRVGWAPLDVQMKDRSTGQIVTWDWDLGDGTHATVQNPLHAYPEGGIYDLALTITTPDTSLPVYEPQFVTVLAETLIVGDTTMQPGFGCVWDISLRNTVPLNDLTLPITLTNVPTTLLFDSISFVGSRVAYFQSIQTLLDNRAAGRYVVRLKANTGGGTAPLAPGSGLLARLYLRSNGSAQDGDSSALQMTPQGVGGAYKLMAHTTTTEFVPYFAPAQFRVMTCSCPNHGDIASDGFLDALDLNGLIDYLFFNGAEPPQDSGCVHVDRGDFNCDGFDDALDLNRLIDALFFGGPGACQPCDCHGYPDGCP